MLWAAYGDTDGLCAALASAAAHAATGFGTTPEDRAFVAHATLARSRSARPLQDVALRALAAAQEGVPTFVSVRSATLFSSTLTRTGPRYEPLSTWEFPS
jgi:2'-5' RNA ligase